MTETETTWQPHEPVFARRPLTPGDPVRDWQVVGCTAPDCRWRSTPGSFSTAGYADHLQRLGAPTHLVAYWHDWADIVEVPFGGLQRDAVAAELYDYGVLMSGASEVYDTLAGLSKPNASPAYVIEYAAARAARDYADRLCEAADTHLQDGESVIAEAMVAQATLWHPDAWTEYEQGRAWRNKMREKLQGNVTTGVAPAMMARADREQLPEGA